MPVQIFLKAEGENSGLLRSNTTNRDFAGQLEILSANFSLNVPVSPSDLRITGRRQFQPLIITKFMDKNSPIIFRMITTNERFNIFELSFLSRQDDRFIRGDSLRPTSMISLGNAFVCNYSVSKAPMDSESNPNAIPSIESISICFETIYFKDLVNNIEAIDEVGISP